MKINANNYYVKQVKKMNKLTYIHTYTSTYGKVKKKI